MIYCVKCKKKTETVDAHSRFTKNGKAMLQGVCKVCGIRKSTFIGKGVINNMLNSGKLPEMHLPGYKYCGPGTKLRERMQRGDRPKNKLDQACQLHDLAYSVVKEPRERHLWDKKLEEDALKIAAKSGVPIREKLESGLVAGIMHGKRKMGMGCGRVP